MSCLCLADAVRNQQPRPMTSTKAADRIPSEHTPLRETFSFLGTAQVAAVCSDGDTRPSELPSAI
ncbi:hypothetical protein EMEDMD4_1070029 [Sinorhizobium medicae]|uniref:Uncharacterized protein n=1 Tax=Sinorhizobium medicae TaxID=110321 RepID=A0A508WUW2_9HYPH|nr:hypothetical protein EMEDMD4_1070029 [Sinorhizobium medicae]